MRLSENDLLDLIDEDCFNTIWRAASCFPPASDFEAENQYTYQTTAYIGYLRGVSDTLDWLSRLIGDELGSEENLNIFKANGDGVGRSALDEMFGKR